MAEIFLELSSKVELLIFVATIVLVINIILWVYVVKIKRLLLKLEEKIKRIDYNTGDLEEKLKEIKQS
ncbi:MAG: hypothetical protein ISS38_04700 [Candidatus Cloacimonetes bacterium]|nr:hypothetical protein [Candidatus Cloacimonadota bacterium]